MDLLLFGLVAVATALGWSRGMVVSLLAFLVVVVVGTPAAALAAAIGSPPPALAFLLGGIIGLVPFALRLDAVTASVEELVGDRWQLVDRIGGAMINGLVALGAAWFVAAVASIVPANSPLLTSVRSSSGMGALVESLPPQGALGVVVLRSGLVPGLNGPLVLAEAPDPESVDAPAVLAARSSVVEIRGTACNLLVTGTGWVAGSGLILTNAHVVAGVRTPFVAAGPSVDGKPGTVTAFDPVNDIAVISMDAAGLPPAIPIVNRERHGERAAILGYPKGGELRVVPARVDRIATYDVSPVAGSVRTPTSILAVRGLVEPGNSGGPILSEDGFALGMVVSKGIGQRVDATYGVPAARLLAALAIGASGREVPTGRCLKDEDLVEQQ